VGCTCDDGWEGDYCEYLVGQAPYRYPERNIGKAYAISFGIAIPTIILSIIGMVIWNKRKATRSDFKSKKQQSETPIGQLQVDRADII
jgi:hypothetical protein